jgi:cation diffusion facilitator family transporter
MVMATNVSKTITPQEEYAEKRKVTVVGAVINLVLSAAKISVGFVANSQGLIADGLHSLADLASDGMVLLAAKLKSKGADEKHPYGHARFETVATIGLGLLLFSVAVGIAVDSIERLLLPESIATPGAIALVIAAVSILSKEWLYHYTMAVARRLESDLIRANAWHHRTDAISSIIVFIGIGGAMAGLTWLDTVAAIGVSAMIAKIGWDIGWPAIMELTDSGVEQPKLEEIIRTIESVDGVTEFHMLRTRKMGREVLVEVHVLVNPCITVSEGHMIGDRVLARLKREHPDIGDVTIHIDPEDDTDVSNQVELPDREQIIKSLHAGWATVLAAESIDRINLHYLAGKIDVEVVLPMSIATDLPDSRTIVRNITDAATGQEHIGNVAVLFAWQEPEENVQK